MEILLGAGIAVVTQLLKKLTNKVGGDWTLLIVFALSVVAAGVYKHWLIDWVSAESVVATLALSVAWYEILLSRIPLLQR